MTDTFGSEMRSWIMSRVPSRGTKPEQRVCEALIAAGMRFSKHRSNLPGNPDVVFTRRRLAVFVNGCFWHWHGCARCRMPATNRHYWKQKIDRNVQRDKQHRAELHRRGWRYLTIWECQLNSGIARCLRNLKATRW
ncbi:MAG TPA: very short patch repair endonuclease [Candidatus Angelobacter sp.]|nr:very short patch repair endonuclease [Candidatus Angelobacter sp.]